MSIEHFSALAARIRERAADIFPEVLALRRDIHLHPELSFEEVRTTALIADYLLGLGITPEPPLLQTGVVALIKGGNASGKATVIALRADIDALPLNEENLHNFCSLESGKMHACGHDMHTAMLLGAANILAGMKDALQGDVLLIFQPAEEKSPGGAKPLLDAGLFKRFIPSAIIGQHCFPNVETGKVALCKGSFMAAADELYFTVTGQGGMHRLRIRQLTRFLLQLILLPQRSILSAGLRPLMSPQWSQSLQFMAVTLPMSFLDRLQCRVR